MYGLGALVPRPLPLGHEELGRIVQVFERHPVAKALKGWAHSAVGRAVFVQESRFLSLEDL